ncbi:MAG: aminoglycoside phosphotransferase family protein [Pseudomonadota bacterium]|uniref:aminoglycoside phosphotransferase family protein n=1 Tax=Phenylobacterium sp. TaxID=1871053 RepID=UPI00271F4B0D|nr:aminoglycoside phosphotransferase family protein [Phenylobacterium sp.]MDO9433152.1 aminoglycoside phosphotransferase family protein [Phenylobacterium sp.]
MSDQTKSGKVRIDGALVTALIAAQFPQWADLTVRPIAQGGWDNRTFHLGERMIVRLPSASYYADQVAKEQQWLPILAPRLPLPIPVPLAMGAPSDDYPWPWSVYGWLEGQTASAGPITDHSQFAAALAKFLNALQRIDTTGGPPAGRHNFYRGGPLSTYDAETRQAIEVLGDRIDGEAATQVWAAALAATWTGPPVWVHGDVSAGNLLVRDGQLSAVIDFGCCCIGDPACDLAIAWTCLEGDSREAFRASLPLGPATWARGRGWTLWKALIVYAALPGANPLDAEKSQQIIDDLIAEHRRTP